MSAPERYVTKQEAADHLGLTPHALEMRVHRREVPFYKLGPQTLRFRLSELDAWVAEQTKAAS